MREVLINVIGIVVGSLAFWHVSRSDLSARAKSAVTSAICAVTALVVFVATVRGPLFAEFREAYYPAGKAVLDRRAALEPLVGVGIDRFTNLPVAAYLFAPLGLLPEYGAAAVFTALGVASLLAAWILIARLAGLEGTRRWLLLFLFCASGPLLYSIRLGNTSHLLLLVLAVALYLLRGRRSVAAGVLLAVAAIIKLPLLLFGAWFLLRRDWRAASGFGAVLAAAGLLSVALFGWHLHERWLEDTVWRYSTHPIGARNVQSVPAFLVRLVNEPGVIYDFGATRAPEPVQRVASFALVGLLYVVALAVSTSGRRLRAPPAVEQERRELEYLLVLSLAMVTSPLSWAHYYVLLLLPIAFLLGPRLAGVCEPWLRRLTWAGIVLATPAVLALYPPDAVRALYAKVFISHLLFAGLILFAALAWARARVGATSAVADRTQRLSH